MPRPSKPCAVIFDLDGVILRGENVIPSAPPALQALAAEGVQTFFLTNNSTRTRADYVSLLSRAGISCSEQQVMSSAYATAIYMSENGFKGGLVLAIGERGLQQELQAAGMQPIRPPKFQGAQAVVVGLDRKFNYEALFCAQQAILAGAKFIASNSDGTYPTENGISPGAGSIVAAVAAATGKSPLVIGKPNTFMLDRLLGHIGCPPARALLVGDRLDTDIQLGRKVGMMTALVLTGVATRQAAEQAGPEQRPDAIIEDLGELRSLFDW